MKKNSITFLEVEATMSTVKITRDGTHGKRIGKRKVWEQQRMICSTTRREDSLSKQKQSCGQLHKAWRTCTLSPRGEGRGGAETLPESPSPATTGPDPGNKPSSRDTRMVDTRHGIVKWFKTSDQEATPEQPLGVEGREGLPSIMHLEDSSNLEVLRE